MTRKNVLMVLTAFVLGVLIVASVSASGLVGATANGGGAPATNATGRTVSVGATGSASAQPDEAVVYVAVTATANDAATARDRVATNATSVRKALAVLVGPDQIRTTSFNVYQRSDATPTKTGTRTHYYATHAFAVTVSNVDSVGTVIDTAINGGASTVQSVQYTLSDATRKKLREQALGSAMSDARSQADTLASNGDLTITGVQSVSTGGASVPRPRPVTLSSGAAGSSTRVTPGPVTVDVSVHVVYAAR